MASRHDIIHIDFQANAGKANAALDSLRAEAARTKTEVDKLTRELKQKKAANFPISDIQQLEAALKKVKAEHKQWQTALNNNLKGVRVLDEAIKQFNKGKGSVADMNAALSKTARNAAQLQKDRSKEGSKTWNEMNALVKALDANILHANTALNQLTSTIKNSGAVSKSELTKAKSDLQQLIALENEGNNAWKKYTSQLKTVEGALTKMVAGQQQMAGKNVLAQVFRGDYITKSRSELEQMIAKLREYQAVIQDPNGTGARHFQATQTAIAKLSVQLEKTKVDAAAVKQALQVAGLAGTANRFGTALAAENAKLARSYGKTLASLNQLQQKRQEYASFQQIGISLTTRESAMLAKLDAQIATTTARKERLRNEMIQTGRAQQLTTRQISESIAILRQQQETVAVGSVSWKQYEASITILEERMKIMKGEAMSLRDAMRLSTRAGGTGFNGTAQQLQMAEQAIQKAMNAARKGSPEWQKYQQALAKVRLEMQNTAMTSERMRAIIAKPANAKNLNELAAAVKRAKAELDLMAGTVGKTSVQYTKLAEQTKKAEVRMRELQAQSHGTATAFGKAWSRLKTYITLYMGAAVAIQKLIGTLGDISTLSDRMGEVKKTTGFAADQVGRLADNLRKLDVRTSLVSLMEVAAKAGQLGLKTEEDVMGFTEAANKLMIALPEMGAEAATELLKVALATGEIRKIQEQINDGLIDGSSAVAVAMTKVGSTIDQLRANSAATAPAITDFVKRVGAVGAQSGITIDQVAALGSTVDALGMRVEMSATALSRMIPAIKNNAFAVAKAIKVEPSVLRDLFNTGRGMEAILMIFEKIKESGMDADSIESMLGMGNMKEVMKELNQMGARAGIVFAGLSQNVDELRRQLGIANDAYEENMAIEREFEKMNETTAAKWARLKNEVEEAFVGDTAQRWLGTFIDGLRSIVNLLTGNVTPAFKSLHTVIWMIIAAWSVFKIGLGEAMWKGLVTGLTALKNAIVALTTTRGLRSLRDTLHFLALETRQYIALKWQLVTAHNAEEKAAIRARLANNALAKSLNANIYMAIIAAIGVLVYKLATMKSATEELDEAFLKLQADEEAAERDVNRLSESFKKSSKTLEETSKRHEQLEKKTEELRKEVSELKKSTDLSSEAQEVLQEKTEELRQSEDELKKSTDEMNKAKREHNGIIGEINSKYSSYLGYMLSEATNSELVASAHWRIVSALRAELEQKRLLENQKAIESKYGEDIKEWTQDSRDELKGLPRDVQDQIMRRRSNMMAQVSYSIEEKADKNGNKYIEEKFVVPSIDGIGNKPQAFDTEKQALDYLKKLQVVIVQQETLDKGISLGMKTKTVTKKGDYLGTTKRETVTTGEALTAQDYVNRIWGGRYGSWSADDGFQRLTTAELLRMQEQARQRYQDQGAVEGANEQVNKKTLSDIRNNVTDIVETIQKNGTLTDKQIGEMGRELNAVVQSSLKYGGNKAVLEEYFGEGNDITLENAADRLLRNLDPKIRKKVLDAARKNARTATGGTTAPTYDSSSSIWGERQSAESLDYDKMNAEQLVARRQQMNEFVKAIQDDTDVERVLKEDAALQKAIAGGLAKNFRSVVEWYNTERLKIQDELYSRHLTNTGDWKDPKKGAGSWRKQLQNDFDTYLKILDAYYTERKAKIEKAQTEEGMSEAEAQRLTVENETVWRKHRMELQKIYQGKSADIAEKERQRIYDILAEQDGEDAKFVEQTIAKSIKKMKQLESLGEKGEVEYRKMMSKLTKDIATDFYKQQNAVSKQMEAIRKIIAQERPFDGLVENLEKDLSTMGVLFADLDKKRRDAIAAGMEPEDDTQLRGQEQALKRMLVLVQQSEDAYAASFDQLKGVMIKEGFGDWAQTIENDDQLRKAMMAMLRKMYDDVHSAIKKESGQIKKELDIWWNDSEGEGKLSRKGGFEKMLSDLGLKEDQVKRANSLIGAGQASEHVADKLAIQQMRVRLAMQSAYYAKLKEIGDLRIKQLQIEEARKRQQGKTEEADLIALDIKHAKQALNLSLSEEQNKVLEQRVAIQNQLEESQNRLYTELKAWGNLLASSIQSIFEASHAGDAAFYNERAKMDLTGRGGPGAGTYIVIEDEGTSDAKAHYEYLNERQALERQREIENENAMRDAFKKVMDDLNAKMGEQITDWMNAALQNQSIDANTAAMKLNTEALDGLTGALESGKEGQAVPSAPSAPVVVTIPASSDKPHGTIVIEPLTSEVDHSAPAESVSTGNFTLPNGGTDDVSSFAYGKQNNAGGPSYDPQPVIDASNKATTKLLQNDKKVQESSQSTFAKMAQAANMYGIAYQTMSNDNLSATQKFEMMALQAIGNYAIGALTTEMAAASAKAATDTPGVLGKLWKELGWAAAPVFAIFTGLLGGLMGVATSKIGKAKSQIAQATGSSSISAGRLSTGMQTYADGNVNEFTDPASLTVGRHYDVDGADGRTYRARYMGKGAKTHITNGPEFHLVGEAGREAIIDAHTTRNIQMNEPEIWRTIQTLYNGGRISSNRTGRGRGVAAFAEGNIDDFGTGGGASANGTGVDIAAMTEAMNRQAAVQEALLERLNQPIVAQNIWSGPDGIPNMYNKMEKEARRHGVKYL